MEAKELLEMIVDVQQHMHKTYLLDEIDARVWCYINNITFKKATYFTSLGNKRVVNGYRTKELGDISKYFTPYKEGVKWVCQRKQYTRSRDALKSIRPDGWCIRVLNTFERQAKATTQRESCGELLEIHDYLPTEELAELHVIIQAIEWERNNV